MAPINTLSPLQSLGSRIENAYRSRRWTKIKGARPDVIFDKDTTWWTYVQPEEYPPVIGCGTTLQAALQGLLDQLQVGPQQWMAIVRKHMFANQATDRSPGMTPHPGLSVYPFAQGSSSNSGNSSSFTSTLPNPLPHNPTCVAPPAERGPLLQKVQQLCNSIRETIPDVTTFIQRPISSSTTWAAPVKLHQQMPTMTPNYMGPRPSNLHTSAGLVSPTVPNDRVVPADMTNPAVSQPFVQGALTSSFLNQTTSDQIGQPSAPFCEATQIEHDLSSLPAHYTSVNIPQVDQPKQGDEMHGASGQTPNPGTGERAQKRTQVEEYSQVIRVEPQSKVIKFEDQPQKSDSEEQLHEIKAEERPSKKIKIEYSD
ncbi:hypothetical protein KCU62_g2860, partial [Aureobasidium sp. EXF-3399]